MQTRGLHKQQTKEEARACIAHDHDTVILIVASALFMTSCSNGNVNSLVSHFINLDKTGFSHVLMFLGISDESTSCRSGGSEATANSACECFVGLCWCDLLVLFGPIILWRENSNTVPFSLRTMQSLFARQALFVFQSTSSCSNIMP